MAHQRFGAPPLIESDEEQIGKDAGKFAKGDTIPRAADVRKNRVVRQDDADIDRAISRSLLSTELEELERHRLAVRARVLTRRGQYFFGGHRSPLAPSAAGSGSGSGSSSVAVSDNDEDDEDGFVARGGTMSPFFAGGGGGEDEEDDDMEDARPSGWGLVDLGSAAGSFAGSAGGGGSVAAESSSEASSSSSSSEDDEPRLGRPVGTGTVVFKRPLEANRWWSVSEETFDRATRAEKYRYTAVANAMEGGSRKAVPCANCVRRAASGLEDLADCKSATPGGRCGRCLWARVPKRDGCP